MADITDVTRAGYILANPADAARQGNVTRPTVPFGQTVAPVAPALDTVVNNFVRTTQPNRMQTVGSRNLQQSMADDAQAVQTNLEKLLASQMYYSGGANQASIQQLQAQRLAAQQNYKTNRADAQNLYGVLSQDIQKMGEGLQASYTTALNESATVAANRQAALSAEQKRQQENRAKAAAELGLAEESALTSYASDEALNTGMGNVAAGASNWENLLRSQQGSAMERTNRLITATGNTKNQTILGMKAYLDAQQAQIDAQIAAERAKTPTQKLTALGKLLESRMNEQIVNELFPSELGQTSRQKAETEAMIDLGLDPKNPADKTEFRQLQQSGSAKLSNKTLGSKPLDTREQIAVDALGIPLAYFNPDYGLYGAGK
jgi:hypothetical protein